MSFPGRILDYGVAALLLLVCAISLRSNLDSPGETNVVDRAVLGVGAPLQAAVSWTVGGVAAGWNRYVGLVGVTEENDQLREENAQLRYDLAVASHRASEAAELERLVTVKRATEAETVGARVIAAPTNPFFRVTRLRVDRGKGEVAVGMPVVDSRGLVGRVRHVFGHYADVMLVTDPQSSVDITIDRTGGRGVLSGVSRSDSYRCKIEYLERQSEVEVGDVVSTSGLGGVFPRGIPVGVVAAIHAKEYGLYQDVEVTPVVDFGSLTRLLVLVAPPPPPDPDAGKDRTSELAHRHRAL